MDAPRNLADYLKATIKQNTMKNVQSLRQTNRRERKNIREAMRSEHRVITDSPIPQTPYPQSTKRPKRAKEMVAKPTLSEDNASTLNDTTISAVQLRMEQLAKWRESREKMKAAQKATAKPLFKAACHMDRDKPVFLTTTNNDKAFKFAATDYKFKAPRNVAPISLTNKNVKHFPQKVHTKPGQNTTQNKMVKKLTYSVSESETRNVTSKTVMIPTFDENQIKCKTPSTKGSTTKNYRKTPKLKSGIESVETPVTEDTKLHKQPSPVQLEDNESNKVQHKTAILTPSRKSTRKLVRQVRLMEGLQNNTEEINGLADSTLVPVDSTESNSTFTIDTTPEIKKLESPHFSPFVTMSRGKSSARKENMRRQSNGASYFYCVLDKELERIQALVNDWNTYKEENDLSDETSDMINVAIGQSNLLMSKKMAQFRSLIDRSVDPSDGPNVTATDLYGFWDIIMMQVRNLDNRFDDLVVLRKNNWKESIPSAKKVVKPKPIRRPQPKRIAKEVASSKLRETIKAARAKKQNENLHAVEFNGGFFKIKSPLKENAMNNENTLLRTVLSTEARKSIKDSPGLAIMRATQFAHNFHNELTPQKSILKSATPNSTIRRAKSVLFKLDTEEMHADVDLINLESPKETPKTLRRSQRTRVSSFKENI